jgi:hypothetical protein
MNEPDQSDTFGNYISFENEYRSDDDEDEVPLVVILFCASQIMKSVDIGVIGTAIF